MALRNKRNGQHVCYTPQQHTLPEVPAVPVTLKHKHPKYPRPAVMIVVLDDLCEIANQYASGLITEREFRIKSFIAVGRFFGEKGS